jgi:hypothetical protein
MYLTSHCLCLRRVKVFPPIDQFSVAQFEYNRIFRGSALIRRLIGFNPDPLDQRAPDYHRHGVRSAEERARQSGDCGLSLRPADRRDKHTLGRVQIDNRRDIRMHSGVGHAPNQLLRARVVGLHSYAAPLGVASSTGAPRAGTNRESRMPSSYSRYIGTASSIRLYGSPVGVMIAAAIVMITIA